MSESTLPVRVARLVGDGKRVLVLGCGGRVLASPLHAQGCQVVAVGTNTQLADESLACCERTVRGNIEEMDLAGQVGEGRFDVAVAVEVVEHVRDPAALLQAVKPCLGPGGSVIVAVPNVAHASVRLALLDGHFPGGVDNSAGHGPLRYFTRASLARTVEDAGYALGHLEREERALPHPDSPPPGLSLELLRALSNDADARASRFIIVAYPLPALGLTWLRQRLRDLVEENEATARDNAHLRQTVELLDQRLTSLATQLTAAAARESGVRAELLAAHEQMFQRDREVYHSVQELLRQRDGLVRERDALDQRLTRFRRSLPGRLYRGLCTALTLGKQ